MKSSQSHYQTDPESEKNFDQNNFILGAQRCRQQRCNICTYIQETNLIKLKNADQIFEIKDQKTYTLMNLTFTVFLLLLFTVHKQQINHPELS